MASLPRPETNSQYPHMRDLHWSQTEKNIARRAFQEALQKEFQAAIHEVKRMAAQIEEPQDLWKLEAHLTELRKEIDRKYDYRYSVLPMVFGALIREGHLREEDLHGLGGDKLYWILECARL